MRYRVVLVESEEGFAVSCPALKGCHSQGATREEALRNIREAIQEWLAAEELLSLGGTWKDDRSEKEIARDIRKSRCNRRRDRAGQRVRG